MRLPLATNKQVSKELFHLANHNRVLLTACVTFQILSGAALVLVPFLVGKIINNAHGSYDTIKFYALATIVVGFFSSGISLLADYFSRVLGQQVFAQMRDNLVKNITRLPLSTVEAAGSADILGRTSHDISNVQFIIQRGFASLLNIIFTMIWIYAAAFLLSPVAALPLLISLPIFAFSATWYNRRAKNAYRTEMAVYANMSASITESHENAMTIDLFGIGKKRHRLLSDYLRKETLLAQYTTWIRVILFIAVRLYTSLPIVLSALWGVFIYSQGFISAGVATTISLYTLQLASPLGELSFWYDNIQISAVALKRIFGLNNVKPDRTPSGEQPTDTNFQLRDVSFAYRQGKPVIHNITLNVKAGQQITVVGPSGSGKSTLARMLAGFHPPTSGQVLLGGVEVTNLPETRLHQEVVLVTQENHTFVGTIADNLQLVCPNATLEMMQDALHKVGAWSWVESLEQGINTTVGLGYLALTEEQAQQLALARIILMNPHTVILDEATSLLDPNGARSLELALASVLKNRTVIAIAHRLWNAENSDRILVMDEGRVVEDGTHTELLQRNGNYANLWKTWTNC